MDMMDCPKCGRLQTAENKECVQCGIIFNKIKNPEPASDPLLIKDIKAPNKKKKEVETICKKCGHLSVKKICPNCQHIKKLPPVFEYIIITVFAAVFLFFLININNSETNKSSSMPHVETRKEKIEKYFNNWDGSHVELIKVVKASMNNPDSYKHVETKYVDKGDHILVQTTFRGTNAFGGVVTNWIWAKCDLNGKVVEIIAQGP